MKKLMLLILTLGSISFAAVASEPQEMKVGVKGMVCAFCAQGIEKTFKSQPEVSDVEVSLENKYVKLKFKQGQALAQSKITQILKDAGYEAFYGQ
ncbi:MAG: heavy-metal-associated domain-containing protein [Pseudobdellovibrio sp.]